MNSKQSELTYAQCGKPIADEYQDSERKPCPDCGSLARSVTVNVGSIIAVAAVGQVKVITSYPQALLGAAKSLIDNDLFTISVVVSHMACEIATERTLSESFAKKDIQYLEEPVGALLNGYNITNRRIRILYTALTGDEIQNQPFWQKLVDSGKRRNNIIHKGIQVEKTEAEESYKATSDLITHLEK